MKTMLLVFSIAFLCSCVIAQESISFKSVPVRKSFLIDNENSNFKYLVRLPCDNNCVAPRQPRTIDEATAQLIFGVDPLILNAAADSLKKACGVQASCDAGSLEVWDKFYELTQSVQIEGGHSLDEYLSGLRISLVSAWKIGQGCPDKNTLCETIYADVVGAPDMLLDIVLRNAILRRAGISTSQESIIQGMGDMLDKRPL